ncbi:MAG: SDR family oxidoreductase [Nocardioidaceae bacterium]|nr:SDR family oxidoreductase [Nocardioidaceae bacterium]
MTGAAGAPGVVVVTGAARGIGRGIAERMVARGHLVVVTDVDGASAERTAGEIGAAAYVVQDVRDPESHRAVAAVARDLGPLAVWFNNAGVGFDGDLAALTDEQVRALVEVNLLGVLWGTRAAIAAFGPEGGDIVNTASLSAHGPVPGLSVYAATKAAVVSVTTSVNAELPRQVRVHALCPDGVDTQMVEDMDDAGTAKALVHSGGRILTVDEVADAAVALVGSRRVVRTVPVWRGALSRSTALTPGVAGRALPLFTRVGRRVIARRAAPH